ncbi:MAG: PilZ domain-containing protein [Bryobacteraceae bacterium]
MSLDSIHSNLYMEEIQLVLFDNSGFSGEMAGSDRRAADRFAIEREVRFRILNKRTSSEEGTGKTVNISSNGVLFTTDQILLPGRRVELNISWPAQLDNKCQLKLVARGRVARLEQGRAAVEIQQYEFRTMGSKGLAFQ